MIITELRQIAPERFALTLEDGESFKVTLNDVADYSLYSGRELTGEELSEVRAAADLSRCKDRAMRIIGARAMSEGELYGRLLEKGETDRNAAATVAWLVELRLLNDAEYAAMLVRHYAAKGYGPRRVQDELYRRKVPKELWGEAMESLPEQEDTVDRLLRSRLRGADPQDRAALKKASDSLLRRGFSWEEIKAAIERYQGEN